MKNDASLSALNFSLRSARKDTFPRENWCRLFDEIVPSYVKEKWAPKKAWKDKPFNNADGEFFLKGIAEMSDFFGIDRKTHSKISMPNYFSHPKFRSSYFLYFYPFQAAKFLTIFSIYSNALSSALEEAKRTGTFTVADFGAGPGTASVALLLHFTKPQFKKSLQGIKKIKFIWIDSNAQILEDGKEVLARFLNDFPDLKLKTEIQTITKHWQKVTKSLDTFNLGLFGNVLNENPMQEERCFQEIETLMQKNREFLFLEPATTKSAQTLSSLRDGMLENGTIQSIHGPCLHTKTCPLKTGKDWCHFSVQAEVPGKWFNAFSRALYSKRLWLKFCFLWSSSQPTLRNHSKDWRRVVSDPLGNDEVLLCEPGKPRKVKATLKRGDIFRPSPGSAPRRKPRAF